MTTTIQALQFNDKITGRRQAQKEDLVDIARALGLAVTSHQALPFLREKLTSELTRIAKAEGRPVPPFNVGGKQVTKDEILSYAHALGSGMSATTQIPMVTLRGYIRTMLTRRAERAEADRKWNEQEDAAAAEFNAREAEFAALPPLHSDICPACGGTMKGGECHGECSNLPAAEAATLTIKLTHQDWGYLLTSIDLNIEDCIAKTNPHNQALAELTVENLRALRAKLAALLPTVG